MNASEKIVAVSAEVHAKMFSVTFDDVAVRISPTVAEDICETGTIK